MQEINDEEIIEDIESENEDEVIDTTNYEIVTYGADYTLSVLYDKLTKDEIIIPNYQRKFVWKQKQASRLIESFLLGLPIPGVFLSKVPDTGQLLVVDGQQRLKSIEAYRNEIFPITNEEFFLTGVHERWEGKKYSNLEVVDRRKIDDAVLRATIIQQINPKDDTSVYHIFERLNTGGTSLQNQEIRNCVYHGSFNELLHELNENDVWRKLYNSPIPSKRLKDEELILRFLSFIHDLEHYTKPLNEFLSKFMSKNKKASKSLLDQYRKEFIDTITIVDEQIGLKAFRPTRNLNMAAFDSVMYTIFINKDKLHKDLKSQIDLLFNNEAFKRAIRLGTTDDDTIHSRIKIAKQYLTNEK